MDVPEDVDNPESFRRGVTHVLNALDAFSTDLRENVEQDPHETSQEQCPECGTQRYRSGASLVCPECDL